MVIKQVISLVWFGGFRGVWLKQIAWEDLRAGGKDIGWMST